MRRLLRENSLSLAAFGLFLLIFLFGQVLTGQREHNNQQKEHREPTVGLGEYLRSGHFGEATFENWESEFLQMGAYVLMTVWFRQKGSPESKKLKGKEPQDEPPEKHTADPDAPWAVRRGGIALALYKNSLALAFGLLFVASLLLHAFGGVNEYNDDQVVHGDQPTSYFGYMTTARFWFEAFQNWQSEFMAVGAIVVLAVYLRQYGSPESKPVHEPHTETGT
jgi:hypothetical protein